MAAMAAQRRSGKWSELVYLDLLCGPGRCVIRNTGETVDGSPLRALKVRPGFDRLCFIDADREHITASGSEFRRSRRGVCSCEWPTATRSLRMS